MGSVSIATETSMMQLDRRRGETVLRTRAFASHRSSLDDAVNAIKDSGSNATKQLEEMVKRFVAKQAGSEDACHSQLLEAKHQLNQLHKHIEDLALGVNVTEEAIEVLGGLMKKELDELSTLEDWRTKALDKCAAEKKKNC